MGDMDAFKGTGSYRDLRPRFTFLLEVLDRVAPAHTGERLDALFELSTMRLTYGERTAAVARLVRILDSETKEGVIDSTMRGVRLVARAGFVFGLLAWLFMNIVWGRPILSNIGNVPILAMGTAVALSLVALPLIAPYNVLSSRIANNRVRAKCAQVLGNLGDPHALTALANASRDLNRQVREQSLASLVKLLPKLLLPDAAPLSGSETNSLVRLLPGAAPDLSARILAVLDAVGAPSAAGAISAFADTQQGELAELTRRVAARLQQRGEELRRRETLLRPTERPDESDTLLHVATGQPAEDPALLLHLPSGEG